MWVKNIQFFFYFTAAESYFQKLSKNFSTNFAETANNYDGHLSRKSFCLTLEWSTDNYSVFGNWKRIDQKIMETFEEMILHFF